MSSFATLVATSRQVAETSSRLGKTRLLANALRAMGAAELELAVLYLSGEIRQGRIGIGPAALRANVTTPAASGSLGILEIDAALADLSTVRGSGSMARRAEILQALFARAT